MSCLIYVKRVYVLPDIIGEKLMRHKSIKEILAEYMNEYAVVEMQRFKERSLCILYTAYSVNRDTGRFFYSNAHLSFCRGNLIGQSPYMAGATCSACSADVSFCVTGLCCM